jgi:hypothetical protein
MTTARKRKQREPSFGGSNAKDPTATWRPNIRPNKGFGFSRRTRTRTRLMAADGTGKTKTDPTSEAGTGGGGFHRFQKGRPGSSTEESTTASACDKTNGIDIDLGATTKSFHQNQNEKHVDTTNNKKDDGVENHQIVPFCNSHGEEGGNSTSLSCGEQKKSENSASATSTSTIPINRNANSETTSAKTKTPDAALSFESNKQFFSTTEDDHNPSLAKTTNDISNLVVPLAPHERTILPDVRGIGNSCGRKGISCHQEMMKTVDKKKKNNTFDIPMTITTVNKCTNKNNQKALNNQEKPIAADSIIGIAPAILQTVVPDSNKINSNMKICSSNDGDRSRGIFSESKSKITKPNTKMSKAKAKAKKATPKAHHKTNENNNCREATPFIHQRTSVAIKNTSNKFLAGTKTMLQNRIDPGHHHHHRLSYEDLPVDNYDRELGIGSCCSRKNLDQACNDDDYGCNYHDDKLSREESKRGGILQPISSSSLLTKANLLALSRRESSTVEETTSFGQREGSDEKDEEQQLNVPKTSLWRNKTEASIDVMGLSPLAELRKRAASVEEDFLIGNRPSSLVATTTRSADPWAHVMKIQQEQSSPSSQRHHRYSHFYSRATKMDSDSESSSPESDGESDRYYYSKHYSRQHNYLPVTPKPKQLLDQFDAVATPEASAKTSNEKINNHPKDRNQYPKNDRITIKDLRDGEMGVVANSLGLDRDGAKNNIVPKYILGKKGKSGNDRETRNKDCSTQVSHPSKHRSAVLDEMIATALESQKKKAKSNKSKRKVNELTRKETGTGRDTGSNKNIKNREAFKLKDRSSIGPPQKRTTKLVFDDETKKPDRARGNARRVSLESPPPPATNTRHLNEELSNAPKVDHERKQIAGDDDDDSSSSCFDVRHQRSAPKPFLGQRQLVFLGGDDDDDDSSDWSADWDNLSIESIPRHRCPRREDSDDRPQEVSFDSFEEVDKDENVPSTSKVYIRRSHRRKKVLNNRCSEKIGKELFPSDAVTHRKTISNPADAFGGLLSSGEDEDEDENVPCIPKTHVRPSHRKAKVLNNCTKIDTEVAPSDVFTRRKTISNPANAFRGLRSSSTEFLAIHSALRRTCRSSSGSAHGVKKVCFITNQSIRRIIILLYVYIVLWVGHDQCNHQSLGNRRSSFGGIKKNRMMRPRIWFSENPSLSLFQASQMQEPTMM